MPTAGVELEEALRTSEAARERAQQLRIGARLLSDRLRAARHALATVVEASRRALDTTRAMTAPIGPMPAAPPHPMRPCALDHALALAGFDDGDLDDLTDDLIGAYRTAVDRDDADVEAALRSALLLIGRHLAADLGPKAAGVLLS